MDFETKSKLSGDDDLDALEQDVDIKKQKKSMFLTVLFPYIFFYSFFN